MITIKPEKLEGLVPRMLELCSRNTPWHRRDWRPGTLELIDEMLSEALLPGTRPHSITELREYMTAALRADCGVSSTQKKIADYVKDIGPSGEATLHDVELARNHAEDLRKTYLQNWANLLDEPSRAGKVDVEGTAKRIVSHLLYCGVSAASVYQVLNDLRMSEDDFSLSDAIRALDEKSKSDFVCYTFAIPIDRMPSFLHRKSIPVGWMTPQGLKDWKYQHARQAASVRHQGGFTLTVKARDINEAAAGVQQILPQLAFKFQAGSENGFSVLPLMWSQEKGTDFPTKRSSYSLKIKAFQRADTLHDLCIQSQTRNILARVEPLQTNDSHVAVVNGWVALESLLTDSGEKDFLAAERMALVVAASYFRTEMAWLAKCYVDAYQGQSQIADEIMEMEQSIERSKRMAELVLDGSEFGLLDEVDQLAIDRMRDALQNPKEVFGRTCKILRREFLRLYRKRNLIVHSGRAVEHGLESVAEKVVPLLINGIDQLLIANIQNELDPKSLAASIAFKASHLEPVGMSKKYSILDLLESD